jgi:hypothetical protein
VASLSIKYLGLPLGASCKAISIWNGIIEKMEPHLANSKRLYPFKRGRLNLVKTQFSN